MSRISLSTSYVLLVAVFLQFVSGTEAHFHDDDRDLTPDEIKRRRIIRIVAASISGAPSIHRSVSLKLMGGLSCWVPSGTDRLLHLCSPQEAAPGPPGYGPPPMMYMPGKDTYNPNQPYGYQQGAPPMRYP
ncbi:hypothetical protein B0H19DRAFT_1057106 [Mycena capillaripes]|nr:hypothetical protein B0H19DRAFT_1057106 [Mycena capillaripes]